MGLRGRAGGGRLDSTAQGAASWSALVTEYYSGDEVKANWVGRACGTYGGGTDAYGV